MTPPDDDAVFDQKLAALALELAPAEVAHLRRTFKRQRAALRSWESLVPPATEPALGLALRDDGAASADAGTPQPMDLPQSSRPGATAREPGSG